MDTRPFAAVPQNYHEIPDLCEKNAEPVFPMKYDTIWGKSLWIFS